MGVTRGSSAHVGAARRLIDAHEAAVAPETRRSRGVHYTPHDLAALLARRAIDRVEERLGRLPETVCDPSCGSGAFLVAVAEELVDRGLDPIDVVRNRLIGHDIDARAVDVARRALIVWSRSHLGGGTIPLDDGTGPEINLTVRDVLDAPGGPELGLHDLVIGNPPFLTQLRSSTALGPQRLAALSSQLGPLDPYVDASAVFLVIASRSVTPGGVACLLQPQSFLSNGSARSVRDRLVRSGGPLEVWSAPSMLFDAQVRVCAITTGSADSDDGVVAGDDADPRLTVTVAWSQDRGSVEPTTYPVERPRVGRSWGFMIAHGLGIPDLPSPSPTGPCGASAPGGVGVLGDLAHTTAGFRDEFYALRDACSEGIRSPHDDRVLEAPARLVTTGLIRPGACEWGSVSARIGGRIWHRPVVDPASVERMVPRIRSWVHARAVPKVLVATQSRVVEACADPKGHMIPMTPVISVEPRPGWERVVDPDGVHDVDIWWLVAALSAPSVSVAALTSNLGSGLSARSFRWSARAVRSVHLPCDVDSWAAGAAAARGLERCQPDDRSVHLEELGRRMLRAHGLDDHGEIFDWWFELAMLA